MGEQEHHSILSTGLLCSGIMRNSRGKLFVYVALLGTFFIIMFIFKRTHSNLKELEGVNQKCQQQRDSLSAQLQVVYEHKNRLEKSLQQEKSEHTHTREECDTQHLEMERKQQQNKDKLQALEKQHTELKSSYSQLDEDKNILERKMRDQLHSLEKQKGDEILKLQTQLNDLLEEKDKLEKSLAAYKIQLQDHMGELNICRLQYEQMESKLNTAKERVKKLQSLVPVVEDGALEEHKHETVPRTNGKTAADVHEKLKNGFSNVAVHKDKQQVLVRPNIQPPETRKTPSDNGVSKYSKDTPAINANHGGLAKRSNDGPVKTNVDMETDLNKKNSETQDQENKVLPETNDIGGMDENGKLFLHQGLLNHPQVQPPHNFEDAGEQGELNLFPQNGMDDQKPQLEQPLNKGHHFSNEIKKNSLIGGFFQANNGLAAPLLQGLSDKHQADNYVHDKHVQQPFEVPHNINLMKRDQHLNDRIADHADGEDDDDDHDGENDEVQLMGGGPAVRGGRFQDNDFEDQDNGENENGAKEEEGVVVAPR